MHGGGGGDDAPAFLFFCVSFVSYVKKLALRWCAVRAQRTEDEQKTNKPWVLKASLDLQTGCCYVPSSSVPNAHKDPPAAPLSFRCSVSFRALGARHPRPNNGSWHQATTQERGGWPALLLLRSLHSSTLHSTHASSPSHSNRRYSSNFSSSGVFACGSIVESIALRIAVGTPAALNSAQYIKSGLVTKRHIVDSMLSSSDSYATPSFRRQAAGSSWQ